MLMSYECAEAFEATDDCSPSAYGGVLATVSLPRARTRTQKLGCPTHHPRLKGSIHRRPTPPSGDWAAPAQAQPPAPCRLGRPKRAPIDGIDDAESLARLSHEAVGARRAADESAAAPALHLWHFEESSAAPPRLGAAGTRDEEAAAQGDEEAAGVDARTVGAADAARARRLARAPRGAAGRSRTAQTPRTLARRCCLAGALSVEDGHQGL